METAFRVENLTVGYEKETILHHLNLHITKGKITTIIGPNGSGKSTLLKTIGRILKKEKGKIFLQEQDMQKMPTKEIAKRLAILSQSPAAPLQLKVEELISFGRYPHRKNINRLSTKDMEIMEWAMDVTNTLNFRNRELGELSGGQRQRVWLAMALAQETDILLLDEPTTYLDMAHQLEVLKIIQNLNVKHGATIVMVLHDINHAARFSHNMIAMKKGKIIDNGPPSKIMTPKILKEVFDIEAKIIRDEDLGVPFCFSYDLDN
ncbi:ABC transporter ATP-binding protein [Fervidibacillus albus]|uniref:ABC transporter ATP-binding protein n=1 Tax=Fervidibacillus albus TaxID=2980026 RepID=A0A9E8LTD5_9BACI|nr:ABC transporter ATP-binding protein [Fervidibacillus albus]WAA09186.1 ABC transporter ATP-binding protein [Fervidibacillus albus]